MRKIRLGIISDDLTGCGDVASQLLNLKCNVKILPRLSNYADSIKADVLILNTGSRHAEPDEAYKTVSKAVKILKDWGADYYYKKVDSTLRGNIGVELKAVADILKTDKIPFCGAYPAMGRTTRDKTGYVNGIKITDSSYGRDPQNPVKESNIERLIYTQTGKDFKVRIYDAESESDVESITDTVSGNVFSGASYWAGILAKRWFKEKDNSDTGSFYKSDDRVMIVSGSLNPISKKQAEYWGLKGKIVREPANINCENYSKDYGDILIKTPYLTDKRAVEKLAAVAVRLKERFNYKNIILNGGDTAFEFIKKKGIDILEAVSKIDEGVVMTSFKRDNIILKSGGYGEKETFIEFAAHLKEQ